ncbi:344_t:CDS:2 [Ambispora leptoticha]|uniref:344_t:CDS:1 n=1 Tax=Ambispora leptoticha TaxID=144679 RepID=A0A9N8ZWT0_9GLOM|nr:344_t:CDS:2 [Ambispora leptoticha]
MSSFSFFNQSKSKQQGNVTTSRSSSLNSNNSIHENDTNNNEIKRESGEESEADLMANTQIKLNSSIAVRPDDITNNNNNVDIMLEQTSGVVSSVSPQTISGGENRVTTSWVWTHLKKDELQKLVLCQVPVFNKEGESVPCAHQFQMSTSTSNLATHLRSQHQIYDPSKTSAPNIAASVSAPASSINSNITNNPASPSVAVPTNEFHGNSAATVNATSGINSMSSSTPIIMRSPSLQMPSSIAMPSSHHQVQILQQPLNQQPTPPQQHQLLIHPSSSIPFPYQQQSSSSHIPLQHPLSTISISPLTNKNNNSNRNHSDDTDDVNNASTTVTSTNIAGSPIQNQSFAPPPPPPERIKMHNKDKQNRLVAKLVAWLVEDSQPFKLIDNQKFRDFCQEMDPRFSFPSINSLNTFTELGLGDFIQSTPSTSSSSSSTNVLVPVKRPTNALSTPSTHSNTSAIEGIASPSKRLKSTSSWVWNHLRKDDSTKIVTCQVVVLNEKNEEVQCGHLFQYSTSTSNLASHLRGTHRILDANTPYTPIRAATTRTNATNASTTFRTRSTSRNRGTASASSQSFDWSSSRNTNSSLSSYQHLATNLSTSRMHPKEKQDRLIFKLVAWMVDDLQPFKLLNSVKFREFCHDMDPKFAFPSIEHVQQIIIDSANGIQEKLVHLIQRSMISFSYTTELWPNDQNSFIAVYVHWITDKFIQKKALLGVGTLPINPTDEHLSQALKNLFDRWQISDKLLATINDDNDSKINHHSLKADHVLCAAHIINTSIESGLAKCDHNLKKAIALNDFLVHRVDKHRDRFFRIQAMVRSDKPIEQAIKQESGNWNSIYLILERLLTLRSATEKREEAAKLLKEKVEAFGDVDIPVNIIKKPSIDYRNPLAAFFDEDLTSSANKTEVDLYLRLPELAKNENKGSLEWWLENASKFPRLALQARIYLGIPGTCVPARRVFSEDSEQKALLNGKRQQLDPNFVHYIMLFKENSILFENKPYSLYFN